MNNYDNLWVKVVRAKYGSIDPWDLYFLLKTVGVGDYFFVTFEIIWWFLDNGSLIRAILESLDSGLIDFTKAHFL